MPVFTVMQSHTRVHIVQKVLDGETHLSHICWSHTMKELGSRVTFARRNSASNITLMNTYGDMKVWSLMCAMNVQSVSTRHLHWNFISWCTQTTKDFAVACVAKILSMQIVLNSTSGCVLMELNVIVFCEHILSCACTLQTEMSLAGAWKQLRWRSGCRQVPVDFSRQQLRPYEVLFVSACLWNCTYCDNAM